jgi:hypothetical protein
MVAPAATWDPVYEEEDGWITHRYELLTSNVLRFAARDVRKERTGTHANLSISLNWVTLAWSTFNIERDEDRVRLANSAYAHLDAKANTLDASEFPKNLFKHALDLFCMGLWDHCVTDLVGGQMAGDPNIAPARPLLGSYILMDAGTILFAPPGMGKSYTSMAMAVCLSWGVDRLWQLTDAWMPLYINVERSEGSMRGRLARVNQSLGLDPETPIPFLNARGKTLADIYEAAQRTIKKEGCKVVFYDSISRSGFGSLNQDDVANKTMDMLNALSPTWVALAHSPRQDDSHAFGSQMFDAAADLTVQLRSQTSKDGYSTGVGLEVIKANDIRKPPLSVHVFEWADDGLTGIRRGRAGEFAELEAAKRRNREDDIQVFLLRVGEATSEQVADEFGWPRNHISSLLSSANWANSRKDGRHVVYSVKASAMK